MNVLIAGGFWAIAKFMVLLCCAIIFIIRAIYFYIKTCKKWRKLTKILYVMTMAPLSASSIIALGGVSNIIKGGLGNKGVFCSDFWWIYGRMVCEKFIKRGRDAFF